ncbi:efflux RND transporter periplasmic adaptor subunit [Neptunicella sp. SCSIO 80796]|uniref:efflux RND transporter periplasmic adaptor subunit n=1 Tax=Neptunicella plasticusilytica TaxID=3117012 RepID=UPI003A4E0CD0
MRSIHKMNRVILLAVDLTLILLTNGCHKAPQTEDSPELRRVMTQVVESTSAQRWREFPGVVEAAQQADLGFRVAGKLVSIAVEEGDHVAQGQVLARLEDADYQIQLNSAKAEYNQANTEFERAKVLLNKTLIARADYDKLAAQRAAALASLEAAQQNLQYTIIKAPFTGIIARRYVDNFEDISTMQPIVTIQDLSTLHIKVDIPETVMIRLKQASGTKVYASFDALPNQQFPLALQAVSTEADPASRTFSVTFNMPSLGNATILPGMSVTVRGTQQGMPGGILVPTQVVSENTNGRFIYVVQSNGDGTGTVHQRAVYTGAIHQQGIVIVSGLQDGERIITAGMSKMSEGLQVRLGQGE